MKLTIFLTCMQDVGFLAFWFTNKSRRNKTVSVTCFSFVFTSQATCIAEFVCVFTARYVQQCPWVARAMLEMLPKALYVATHIQVSQMLEAAAMRIVLFKQNSMLCIVWVVVISGCSCKSMIFLMQALIRKSMWFVYFAGSGTLPGLRKTTRHSHAVHT